jgi:hypothetical protein
MNLRPSLTLPAVFFVLLTLSSAACNTAPAATPEAQETLAPTTPLPTLNPTEKAIVLANSMPTETAAPAPTLDPTQQAFVIANILPTPTSDGSPYPITWRVTPYTTYDGRTAYMVDDRQVLRAAETVFEEWATLMTFSEGLPPRDQYKNQLESLIDNPVWVTQLLTRYDQWANENKGYWKKSPRSFDWSEELTEYSADGSEVLLSLHTPAVRSEWFDLEVNRVTHVQDNGETLWAVKMRYSSQIGRWMLLYADAKQSEGPVVTATPQP